MKLNRKKIVHCAVLMLLCLNLLLSSSCAVPSPEQLISWNSMSADDSYSSAAAPTDPDTNMNPAAAPEEAVEEAAGDSGNQTETEPVAAGTDASAAYSDADMYPYYARLTDAQKGAYQEIVAGAEAGQTEFPLNTEASTGDVDAAATAVICEQPQLFWLDSWGYSYDSITGQVYVVKLQYNALADDLQNNINTFEAAAQAVLCTLDGLTDVEKEKTIHDFIAGNTIYESGTFDQTAYSVLVEHTGVCAAYTRAFQYLMQCAGIPAYQCSGTADGGTGWDSHSWNIVKLGDGYYNVDVTWDETDGSDLGVICYNYYNQTDAYFYTEHQRDAESEFLPACTASEYSYESLYGVPAEMGIASELDLTYDQPITSLEEYNQLMLDAITANGTGTWTYSFMVSGDACEDEISQSISDSSIQSGYLNDAATALGLNGYSSSISYSDTDLGNGYHYIVQEITLN